MKANIIAVITLFASALLSATPTAGDTRLGGSEHLRTYKGTAISLDSSKLTHWVFMDLWASYEGGGDEQLIAQLPEQFNRQIRRVWVQPELNVTAAQLQDFQQAYPTVKPLVLDHGYRLMREHKVWQSPYHILTDNGVEVFRGTGQALSRYVHKRLGKKHRKPLGGDKAPDFVSTSLSGETIALPQLLHSKPLNLVFIDALCPMPHFPHCEAQIEQLNKQVARDKDNHWLAVINSYYVDEPLTRDFVARFALKLPVIFDRDNSISKAYGVFASPYQVAINRDGTITSRGDLDY